MKHDITQMTVKGKCIKGVGLELWFGKIRQPLVRERIWSEGGSWKVLKETEQARILEKEGT